MNKNIVCVIILLFQIILMINCQGKRCEINCGQKPPTFKYRSNYKVLGGEETDNELWPWVFKLKLTRECISNYCTAQLISPSFLISAAHCLFYDYYKCKRDLEIKEENFVAFSNEDLEIVKNKKSYKVKKYYIPEKFKANDGPKKLFVNDIALIQLEHPINDMPVCLAKSFNPGRDKSHEGFIVGYGRTEIGSFSDEKIRVAEVFLSKADIGVQGRSCRRDWGARAKLCSGADNYGGLPGDSGGGVYSRTYTTLNFIYFTHGTLSEIYKNQRNRNLHPDVLCPLADFCSWIESKTKNEAKCIDKYAVTSKIECNPYFKKYYELEGDIFRDDFIV